MIVEDDFLSELQDYENRIVDERKLREEERRLKEEERKLKEEAQMKQEEAIKFLLELGVSKDEIESKLNIPLSDMNRLIKE